MTLSNKHKKEENAYLGEPLQDLTLQDGLVAVAAYASQAGRQKDSETVAQIAALARAHPLFKEGEESLRARIHHIVNQMRTEAPLKVISRWARSLTPELRQTAFEWAVRLAGTQGDLSGRQREILEQLALTLTIEMQTTRKIMAQYGLHL